MSHARLWLRLRMLHPWASGKPTLVNFNVEYAWLTRNDKEYITDVRIGNRHYGFNVDEKGRVVSRTAHGITLRTDDTSNLAAPNADFHYMRIPSPWRGVRHMVDRQQGNVLDLTGEGCGLIRGEEQYQQWSRRSPSVWLLRMPFWEYCFYILCLQGAITLCLLPGVLMMQKRGLVRAICFSFFMGLLLSALVASAFLLIPYSEHNWMTWTYTLVPGMIALVLLWLTCRKRG